MGRKPLSPKDAEKLRRREVARLKRVIIPAPPEKPLDREDPTC